jgi:ATP-binding cassette subfamily F protein 3
MLRAENLQFRRGSEVLFEQLSFVIHAGQRVAIAGRNGVGKSTLFQLILGQLQPDAGELNVPEGWRLAYMQQEVPVTQRRALEFAVDGHHRLRQTEEALKHTSDPHEQARLHAAYDDLGGYSAHARAGEILHGLGFAEQDFEKPYAEFSGGWRIRLHLAQALMNPCDLLLLDEPTNHLDLEAIMWLESWLARFSGTVLVIAHDRAFLDACTNHTLYLSHQSGRMYSGNYSACERQRAEYLEQQQALGAKRDAQAAHIQKFVDRFRAKASKAKQVQSRIKALERLQDAAIVQLDSPYSVSFQDPDKVSNPLFSLRDVSLGYDGDAVLEGINLSILPGDRIGVLGANGAGKSTLLKALVGDLKAMAGEFNRGQHCEVGYFAQHQLETLKPADQPLAILTRARPAWREQQSRDYLGRWGFDAGMIERAVTTLSGGEKARLVLALIALAKPAILVLDEPTNHLDLDMRDALALALQDYAGAVVIVSHDRVLLDKTVDDFWVLENRNLSVFRGDLNDYTSARKKSLEGSDPDGRAGVDGSSSGNNPSRKVQRQDRAKHRESIRHLRDAVKRLERDMDNQGEQLQVLESRLADTEIYQAMPAEELDRLLAEAGKLRTSLQQTEDAWLQATAELEAAQELP